ncbi:MAG: hypothetical protein Q9180_008839, partial [Flavoplaca navasiana]
NCLTLIPITHPSNPQKPGLRGQYRIPPELYDSLSRFLDPNVRITSPSNPFCHQSSNPYLSRMFFIRN